MKKSILIVLALISGPMSINAKSTDAPSTYTTTPANYDFKMRLAPISRTLNLDQVQREEMETACDQLNEDLVRVKFSNKRKQTKRLNQAVAENITTARECLTREQYRSYLRIINEVFNRYGLCPVLDGVTIE